MITIFWALLVLDTSVTELIVHTDSLIAVHVFKIGYTSNSILNLLNFCIQKLILRRCLLVSLSHIRGLYNVRADQLSRGVVVPAE